MSIPSDIHRLQTARDNIERVRNGYANASDDDLKRVGWLLSDALKNIDEARDEFASLAGEHVAATAHE